MEKKENARKFPEIPFSKLLSEKILPFEGPATLTSEKEAYSDGILLLSMDFIVLYANSAAQKLLASDLKDLVDTPLNIPGLQENTTIFHSVNIESSQRIIEVRTSVINLNKDPYILTILHDVTRHYESMERLHFAIDATQLGLWDHHFLTNSTSINSYYATMLGYTFEEFETSSWINLIHPIDLELVWDEWNKHIDREIPFYFSEYRIRTKSGEWKWVRARGMVKDHDENANPLHLIGTHQDITSQKQAERELQLSYNINAISNELIPLEEKLEKILGKIMSLLNADKGLIHLIKKEENLELSVSHSFSAKQIFSLEELSKQEAIWNISILKGNALIVSDQDPGYLEKLLVVSSTSLAVVIPIKVQQQTLGLMSIFWEKAQPFTDLDNHIALVAANQLAESIERENLRQTVRNAVVDKERQRLARELHDSLSQSLYSVLLTADGGEDFARLGDIDKTRSIFKNIKETIQQALKEMRLLVYELRPSILSQEGLPKALKHRLDAVEKRAGIQTIMENHLINNPSAHIETELYGIAQEALNNVFKHSQAKAVRLLLTQSNNHILMEIADNGRGFNYNGQSTSTGFGLSSMKERADQIVGTVEIISSPGKGTRIKVQAPMNEAAENDQRSM